MSDIRGSALLSAAKSNNPQYQSNGFVCVSVISGRMKIIVQICSIRFWFLTVFSTGSGCTLLTECGHSQKTMQTTKMSMSPVRPGVYAVIMYVSLDNQWHHQCHGDHGCNRLPWCHVTFGYHGYTRSCVTMATYRSLKRNQFMKHCNATFFWDCLWCC